MYRNHVNGTLRKENVGQEVTLVGWVAKRRVLGALLFLDLRDTTGIVRVTDYEYLPYWVYKGTCQGKYQYHILPAKHAVENSAWYDLNGEAAEALKTFYKDTKTLIDSVPESQFEFTSTTR